MGLRESLNRPVVAVATIIVVIACIAVIWVTRGNGNQPLDDHGFFYDLDRREVFVMKAPAELPPVNTTDGTKAVRAVMFGCGGCDDSAARAVGYLEMWNDEAKKAVQSSNEVPAEASVPGGAAPVARQRDAGHMVAHLPQGDAEPQWYQAMSPAGQAILNDSMLTCEGNRKVHQCSPRPSDLD